MSSFKVLNIGDPGAREWMFEFQFSESCKLIFHYQERIGINLFDVNPESTEIITGKFTTDI
jgi:hypothetical protein